MAVDSSSIRNGLLAAGVAAVLMSLSLMVVLRRGEGTGELAAWLRRILIRNLADAVRDLHRAKRDVDREQPLGAVLEDSSLRLSRWLAAEQTSPSAEVARAEELLRLARALETLPEAQQEALVLRHWQGLRVKEIAEQMDRSPAAVAGLLRRGARALRELLEGGKGDR